MITHHLRIIALIVSFAGALHAQPSSDRQPPLPSTPSAAPAETKEQPGNKALIDRWAIVTEARERCMEGKYASAVAHLEKAVHHRKDAAPRDLQLAQLVAEVALLARNESDAKTAKAMTLRAVELADRRSPSWKTGERAQAALLAGQLSENFLRDQVRAKEAYEEVLQLDPKHKHAQAALSRLQEQTRQHERNVKAAKSVPGKGRSNSQN